MEELEQGSVWALLFSCHIFLSQNFSSDKLGGYKMQNTNVCSSLQGSLLWASALVDTRKKTKQNKAFLSKTLTSARVASSSSCETGSHSYRPF